MHFAISVMSIRRFSTLGLFIGAALFYTGCQLTKSSKAWNTVTQASIPRDSSEAYAQSLHRLLAEQGIKTTVVTFRYAVNGYWAPETRTETAVLYRNDETTPNEPWWLMDNTRGAPLWLPNG